MTDRTDNARAQPYHIIFQDLKSIRIAVAGDDGSTVLHELSQVARFAARCGACIQNFLFRFRIQKLAGKRCAGVLDVAMTRSESSRWQDIKLYKIGIVRQLSRVRIDLQESFRIDP